MEIITLYQKAIDKLIEEINLYKNENDIWKLKGSILNPAGNLAIHLCGSLNHFIGKTLGDTGYIRDRDAEFSQKDVPRLKIISDLQAVREVVTRTLSGLTESDLEKDFPHKIGDRTLKVRDVLIFFLGHFNYHLGQVNYHRRMMNA